MVVVAIDKDKGSQGALKWAVDNLLSKGKSVTLLHVRLKHPVSLGGFSGNDEVSKVSKVTVPIDGQTKELFFPFRCFCTRKDVSTEFCNVYVISKGKMSSVRKYCRYIAAISIRGNASNRSYGDFAMLDTDMSFVSSGRPSTERRIHTQDQDMTMASRLSNSSDTENRSSFGSPYSNAMPSDATYSFGVLSSSSYESGNYSWSGSQSVKYSKYAG